jgi:ABC-type enterochelin transport system substrate-binding protein
MTRSKVDLATHLLKLCNDTTTKPEDLANVMTIRKLHYEIEKAEAELEEIESKIQKAKESAKTKKPKSFWAFLTMDSSDEE